MKKKPSIILMMVIMMFSAGFLIWNLKGKDMKLIHKKTKFVVAKQNGNKIEIKDPFLESDLRKNGISIPLYLRYEFEGKSIIKIEDPLFEKAFKNVYMKLYMKEDQFEWERS